MYILFPWLIFQTKFYQGNKCDFAAWKENLGHIILRFYLFQLTFSSIEHTNLRSTLYLFLQSVKVDQF